MEYKKANSILATFRKGGFLLIIVTYKFFFKNKITQEEKKEIDNSVLVVYPERAGD